MGENVKICFTCRRSDCNKFYNAQNCDRDKICYLEKLKFCVSTDLIEVDNMEMCWLCIKHLRISYEFRRTVLMSQELLNKGEDLEEDFIKKESDSEDMKVYMTNNDPNYMKSESDSYDFCIKSDDYSSDDSSSKDIMETVKSLTKKIEKSRKRHQKSKDDLIYTCEYCGSQFNKQWQLRKHIARVHNEVRKFVCTYCDKEFKQSYHLKEHITSHTGEKNYSCTICDKKFQRLSSQRRHIKSHDAPPGHKTKRTPFLCTICGKSFPFSNGVQRHMRIHLGIKNFECNLCNRRFTQSTHLQVHMRTHTGEKPYICDTCGEKFSLKSCMLKHINNRHYSSKNLAEELPIFYIHKDFDQT